jgi:hypothetical protein
MMMVTAIGRALLVIGFLALAFAGVGMCYVQLGRNPDLARRASILSGLSLAIGLAATGFVVL